MMAGLSFTLGSCTAPEPATQAEPEPAAEAWTLPGPEAFSRLAEITVDPGPPPPDMPRGAEVVGLMTALLELGLGDVDGVRAQTSRAPPPPGLSDAPEVLDERWTLRFEVEELPWTPPPKGEPVPPHQLVARGTLTHRGDWGDAERPTQLVYELSSRAGTREDPTPAVDELIDQVVGVLRLARRAEVVADARLPPSADPYAILLAGRAAASWYGLLPATPEPLRGDKRRDPVARALLVDPDTAVGNWIAGRRELLDGQMGLAVRHMELAAFARPGSVLLRADAAAALAEAGRAEAAWAAWAQVEALRPGDRRFTVAAARAALVAGHPDEARDRLDGLPEEHQRAVPVATLRATVAEALGLQATPVYDALLATWAEVAPQDAEPVRRRVHQRARAGAWADALALTPELERRGQLEEATRAAISLEAALGSYEAAATRADAAGEAELARRLRARGASTPAERVSALGPPEGERAADPVWLAVRAEALLCAGEAQAALQTAERALALRPGSPEALDVASRAASGPAAAAYAGRLRLADPAFSPGSCDG